MEATPNLYVRIHFLHHKRFEPHLPDTKIGTSRSQCQKDINTRLNKANNCMVDLTRLDSNTLRLSLVKMSERLEELSQWTALF
jgi:hypothetical protein